MEVPIVYTYDIELYLINILNCSEPSFAVLRSRNPEIGILLLELILLNSKKQYCNAFSNPVLPLDCCNYGATNL